MNYRRRPARRGGSDGMRFIEIVVVPFVRWAGPAATSLVVYLAFAFLGLWELALFIALAAAVFAAFTSKMPCRVETRSGTPCRKQVRGILGACEWHGGYKATLPQHTHQGLMWSRPGIVGPQVSVQSGPVAVPSRSAIETNLVDMWMLWLAIVQVIFAAIQTVRTW